jgi:hypothetical protein
MGEPAGFFEDLWININDNQNNNLFRKGDLKQRYNVFSPEVFNQSALRVFYKFTFLIHICSKNQFYWLFPEFLSNENSTLVLFEYSHTTLRS